MSATPQRQEKGLFSACIGFSIQCIVFVLLGWFLAGVISLILFLINGFVSTSNYLQSLLQKELIFLDHLSPMPNFNQPFKHAIHFENFVYQWLFIKTHFISLVNRLPQNPLVSINSIKPYIAQSYPVITEGSQLMITTTELTAVRLITILYSLPLILLVDFIGLIDGLVLRDLRRFGGGRESALIYHRAKAYIKPTLLTGYLIYLVMPFYIAPFLIFIPFALLWGWIIRLTAKTFKKYI